MADVPVIISFTRVPRIGSTPSNPPIFENPQDPVNPDGSGFGVDRFIALKDVFDSSYTSKVGFVPVVNAGETGLELVEITPLLIGAVPSTRNITINGINQDLSQDRTWNVGTVTSVGLSAPSIFDVTGSPITQSGTIGLSLANQSAFTVFARGSGSGVPSFQSLSLDHLPNNIGFGKIQDITGATVLGRQSDTGEIQQLTPAQARSTIGAIGGTIASGQVAFGTGAGIIGGVESFRYTPSAGLLINNVIDINQINTNFLIKRIPSTGGGWARSAFRMVSDDNSLVSINIGARGSAGNSFNYSFLGVGMGSSENTLLKFTPNGLSILLSGTTLPTQALDINGNVRIRSLTTEQGDFVQANATGVLQRRTASQVIEQLGAIGGTIGEGQVAFGTGANQIGGDAALIWDNVSRRLRLWVTGGATLRAVAAAFVIGSDSTTGNRIILRPDGDLSTANQIDINKGDLKFNGAQTIQTSTGNLTLATGGGNGNILLSPNGSGSVGISTTPTQKLDINGNVRIRSLTTNQGDFVQANATGVLQRRTASQVIEQLGISPSSYERDLFTFASSYSFTLTRNSPTAVQVFRNGQKKEFGDDWTISGNVVTINSTNVLLEVGDEISIEYFYSTPDIVPSNLNGTGQAGRLTKWNSSTELGISLIEETTGLISVLGKLNIQNVGNTAGNFLTINSGEVNQRTASEAVNDLGIFGTGANQVRVNTDLDDRYLQDAPQDGEQYARKDGDWSQLVIPEIDLPTVDLGVNRYHFPMSSSSTVIAMPEVGEMRFCAFYQMLFSNVNKIADRIAVNITGAGSSNNEFRLGIFEFVGATMNLVNDCGLVNAATTGVKELTINVELEARKLYFLGIARQNSASNNIVFTAAFEHSGMFASMSNNIWMGDSNIGYRSTGVTGAFASDYTPTGPSLVCPMITLRLQNI